MLQELEQLLVELLAGRRVGANDEMAVFTGWIATSIGVRVIASPTQLVRKTLHKPNLTLSSRLEVR